MSTVSIQRHELEQATILFAGDSGDGMQLTGGQFTSTSASFGNDVSTLPDYPAEIRAPAGSLGGVSAFQIHFSSREIHTPGDECDALVAMNPAALRVNLGRLRDGGILIANKDTFTGAGLKKALYEESPLEDPELDRRYRLHAVPITTLTLKALEDADLNRRAKSRCKNLFTLGLLYWMYGRSLDHTLSWIEQTFAKHPAVAEANRTALKAGYHYGETVDAFAVCYTVGKKETPPGTYRIINGNEALALGFVTAARRAGKPLIYSSYPITPASDVLHHLARMKHLDVRTLQLEDEIAAMGSAIGAAFGGAFALTGTSGPGICLKSEAINLAVMVELPVVVLSVQRGGPSTGLPTKTEQTDLLQAMFGRNGESPLPVLAPASPADCFDVAVDAFRIAVRHMTPVMLLSDSYLANSAEPWRIPDPDTIEPIDVQHPTEAGGFLPYARESTTLARPWVVPGTRGMTHRLGGLEKERETGHVSYDPVNHEEMCRLRAEKIQRIAEFVPPVAVEGPPEGALLVVSWGGTYGAVTSAVQRARDRGGSVAHVHLRYLNPFPRNLGAVLSAYRKVLVPELNFGQLAFLLRARHLVDAIPFSKVRGQPFTATEVEQKIEEVLS